MPAQPHQVLCAERKFAPADAFGRPLEIRKVVVRHLLVQTDEQMCELTARRAGLRQQFGNRRLQQLLREQERGLEGHGRRRAGGRLARSGYFGRRIVVEKPARLALKQHREEREHFIGWHAFAAFDHAQVRHRRSGFPVELDAAGGEFLERKPVALPQCADLGAEEMALAGVSAHLCEIYIVKFC